MFINFSQNDKSSIMKKLLIIMLLLFSATIWVSAQRRVQQNQDRMMRMRIAQGLHNGTINRGQAIRLLKQQRNYDRCERRFNRDGNLSPREQRILAQKRKQWFLR